MVRKTGRELSWISLSGISLLSIILNYLFLQGLLKILEEEYASIVHLTIVAGTVALILGTAGLILWKELPLRLKLILSLSYGLVYFLILTVIGIAEGLKGNGDFVVFPVFLILSIFRFVLPGAIVSFLVLVVMERLLKKNIY